MCRYFKSKRVTFNMGTSWETVKIYQDFSTFREAIKVALWDYQNSNNEPLQIAEINKTEIIVTSKHELLGIFKGEKIKSTKFLYK